MTAALSRGRPRSPAGLLLERPPRVYLGPNAETSLGGKRGLLLGSRRPDWIDVLEFEPRPEAGLRSLVDLRFAPHPPWEVVGLSLSSDDLRRGSDRLLRDLVPGDVLLTEAGPRVHSGLAWVRAKLIRERRVTSAR